MPEESKKYFVEFVQCKDMHRLWWRPEAKGYTYNIDEAGIFDEDFIKKLTRVEDKPRTYEEVMSGKLGAFHTCVVN